MSAHALGAHAAIRAGRAAVRAIRAAVRTIRAAVLPGAAAVLAGCAGATDHFYALSPLPDTPRPAVAEYSAHAILRVAIPPTDDRRQMIVDAPGDRKLVLEHERWVSGPSDLVSQTLASDLERRRAGLLVAGPAFDQAGMRPIQIRVDIVRMSARRGGQAALEAHWRVVDPRSATDTLGGDAFTAPIEGDEYAAIARAYSACLAALADRLAAALPVP